jgi:two-component system sensor histidine kinase YesM
MRLIPVKKGLFTLLIMEAVVIAIVSIAFMVNLYDTYTNLVYRESAEVLSLHALIADAKLSEIESLSFEVLSNHDIQSNLTKYYDSSDLYGSYQAANDLYTQLFTRWIMNKSIVSISFVFLDGTRVDTGRLHIANLTGEPLDHVISVAREKNGSCGWVANMAGDNVITLYRLIRDISGNKFRPLGTLIMNVDASGFLATAPVISEKYSPDIVCIAGDQVLSRAPLAVATQQVLDRRGNSNAWEIVRLGNELHFVSTKTLSHNDWSLVYMLSTRDLLSSINSINVFYTISLVLIVIVVVTIGYGFANAISRPLIRLTKAMGVVEAGDYTAALNDYVSDPQLPQLGFTEVAQLSRGFSKMVQEIDRLVSEVYTRQLMIMEMKYKMLQQQINPHFLYNTLDTINWKATQLGNQEIPLMVRSLSKLLRGSVKGPDIIAVGEDLEFVEHYIRIQKMRFEDRLDFRSEIASCVHLCRIPRLTLQPIVENCIIHNVEKYSQACQIRLISEVSDGKLKISVEDDGRGVDLHHIEMVLSGQVEATNTSIGLRNINERVKMAFGEGCGVSVENRVPTGTRVTVTLPYVPPLEGEAESTREGPPETASEGRSEDAGGEIL